MGRLTLNVLLSFAQFEREVTSERIRDKIAASKRKGIWVGGNLPLGYEMKDGKIAIVEEEAELVRSLFRRYSAASTNWYGTSENVTSEPKQSSSRRVRRAAASRSAVARYTICWAITSTSVRSNTRTRSCRASLTRAVLRTLRKIWAADFDLAAAGGAGHRRIAEMSLIEARLRSTLASGCDDAARPARRRLETRSGVHHRGDLSRTPTGSSPRPSMLSSPPPLPSDSDVDRRTASCSHSRNN